MLPQEPAWPPVDQETEGLRRARSIRSRPSSRSRSRRCRAVRGDDRCQPGIMRQSAAARPARPGCVCIPAPGRSWSTIGRSSEYFGRGTEMLILLTRPLVVTDTVEQLQHQRSGRGRRADGQAGAVVTGHCPCAVSSRREPAPGAEVERPADPRCACQGAQEIRPQARPQGAAVHEALNGSCDIADCGFWIGAFGQSRNPHFAFMVGGGTS